MENKEQSQKAGNNSQQIQAEVVNVIQGIDEKRAWEICNETFERAKKDFTRDAYIIATQRVEKFEDKLMSQMTKIEGAIEKFADPAFQLLLTDAHRAVVATEREMDYDLLSELMVHRVECDKDRKKQVGISKAVEIVNQISDDALMALSLCFTILYLEPSAGMIEEGVRILDDLFGKLLYDNLPVDEEWIEHLDLLGAIRVSSLQSFRKVEEIYCEKFSGYVCVGIKKDSDNYMKACEMLTEVGLEQNSILVKHELLDGYVRVPIVKVQEVENIQLLTIVIKDGRPLLTKLTLNAEQKQVLKKIIELYEKDTYLLENVKKQFQAKLKKANNLSKIVIWWNSIKLYFTITRVGRILAHVNAKRLDNNLPNIDN